MEKKTLLQLKDEYIALLNSEIESLIGLANVHGWKSRNVQAGIDLREQIALLEVKPPLGAEGETVIQSFVNWHNLNYPDNYIPNSHIGIYNMQTPLQDPLKKLTMYDESIQVTASDTTPPLQDTGKSLEECKQIVIEQERQRMLLAWKKFYPDPMNENDCAQCGKSLEEHHRGSDDKPFFCNKLIGKKRDTLMDEAAELYANQFRK